MHKPVGSAEDSKIEFTFEGRRISASKNASVASALLAAGETTFRFTPVSRAPRGPFCMMGMCFDCLVEIDDIPNRQACMTRIKGGMAVRRQNRIDLPEES